MEEAKEKITGKIFDYQVFAKIMQYAKKYKLQFVISVITIILLAVFSAITPLLIKEIVDTYIAGKDAKLLLWNVILMFAVLLAEVILQLMFIYYANWLGQNVVKDMRIRLFSHLLQFRMKFFNKQPVGKLVTRVVSDIETIESIFSQGLFTIISDLLKMAVIAGVMLWVNWKLALIVFGVLPILIYATKVFQKAMKTAFQDVRTEVANLNTFVQERITGMSIIQLFTRESIEYENFKEINDKHKKAWIKTVWYNSVFFPIAEVLPFIATGLIVWYGGMQAAQNDSIKVGDIISFIMMINMLFRPLRQIADKFTALQMGMVSADRVFDVLESQEQEPDTGTVVKPHIEGKITIKDLHFSYLPGEEVLKGIDLKVKPGETVAFVGATGAGKSTIINLLNRFYPVENGSIEIDDIPINEYKLHELREHIAVVLQSVFLFSDTIYNNITLKDPNISREDVIRVAEEIGIHDFIMSLPGGYDYNVKERGIMLSSGQRQLIAFLRASVSNPSILILDEATSSIDAKSEFLIQEATEKITRNRTSIIIAHRLATIKKADKIVVMDKGRIVEQGTHSELLAKDGYYSNLYNIQFLQKKAG
jgi:subfamily B ATP-binding cassette protein MsbA